MPIPLDAPEVLNREYLEIRAKLLELAAAIDRMDRAVGAVRDDPRINQILQALDVLSGDAPDRAEQIQLIFSREYEDDWQDKFDMPKPN